MFDVLVGMFVDFMALKRMNMIVGFIILLILLILSNIRIKNYYDPQFDPIPPLLQLE